jgi:hypothetical protein
MTTSDGYPTAAEPMSPDAMVPKTTGSVRPALDLSTSSWSRKDTAFVATVMLGSLGLFVWYLAQNVERSFGDEAYYVIVADRILHNGLWELREELRTYLYPLILAFAKTFFGAGVASKALVGVAQYLVFLFSLKLLARTVIQLTRKKAAGLLVFAAAALNPYLVQATTLFLTDILAACLVTCGFIKLLFGDLRLRKNAFLATLPFAAVVMVRPAAAVFAPLACLGLAVRRYVEPIPLRKAILGFVLSMAFLVPQLHMNVTQFKHWTPIVHYPLYRLQTHEAVRCVKYGTVIIPGERAPLCFANPLADKSCQSMQALALKSPLAFAYTAAAHVFGVFDWGYVDNYITSYYPSNRLPASILLHSTWFLAAIGFIRFLRRRRTLPAGRPPLLFFLAAAMVADLCFLATTQVESRFGYPIFLMAMPFLGFAIPDSRPSRKLTVMIALSWLLWMGLSTALSFWMDGLTGRILWFSHLK